MEVSFFGGGYIKTEDPCYTYTTIEELKTMNKTILEFAFETGDASCRYWQEFVVVDSDESIDYKTLEDSIGSYMDSEACNDKDYDEMVIDIMDASGLDYEFMGNTIPASKTIYTFWI